MEGYIKEYIFYTKNNKFKIRECSGRVDIGDIVILKREMYNNIVETYYVTNVYPHIGEIGFKNKDNYYNSAYEQEAMLLIPYLAPNLIEKIITYFQLKKFNLKKSVTMNNVNNTTVQNNNIDTKLYNVFNKLYELNNQSYFLNSEIKNHIVDFISIVFKVTEIFNKTNNNIMLNKLHTEYIDKIITSIKYYKEISENEYEQILKTIDSVKNVMIEYINKDIENNKMHIDVNLDTINVEVKLNT